jgi:COP9 signalosome complex subunit 6
VKDVHKSPALDLVGWYTIVPISGPQQHHVVLQTQLSCLHSESTILLGFHPEAVLQGSVGGKLPLTIYEANIEQPETGADVEMTDGQSSVRVTFKELPYSVETGEAEMIGIDFVARGGGNATAVEVPTEDSVTAKGKKKKQAQETKQADSHHVLSPEDEELVASLTAKLNAIKMLHSRINLITAYLENLPPYYVAGNAADADKEYVPVNHSIIRSIQALLNRLALLIPSDKVAFSQELLAEQNDVNLVALLSRITESIKEGRELGRKFAVVDNARGDKKGKAGHSTWSPSPEAGRSLGGPGDLMM